jgi:hypothetical protein
MEKVPEFGEDIYKATDLSTTITSPDRYENIGLVVLPAMVVSKANLMLEYSDLLADDDKMAIHVDDGNISPQSLVHLYTIKCGDKVFINFDEKLLYKKLVALREMAAPFIMTESKAMDLISILQFRGYIHGWKFHQLKNRFPKAGYLFGVNFKGQRLIVAADGKVNLRDEAFNARLAHQEALDEFAKK